MGKKLYTYKTPIGVCLIDEDMSIVDFFLYSKDPKECARVYLFEYEKFLENLRSKLKDVEFIGEYRGVVDYASYLISTGIFDSEDTLKKFLNEALASISRELIKREIKWDRIVINLADTIDDLNKIINLMYERLMELYGIYFPEFVELYEGDIEEFASVVYELFDRERVGKKYSIDFEKSIGIDLDESTVEIVKLIAKEILNLYELKRKISFEIDRILKKHLPNTLSITGPLILAKLLSTAGSIERLVRFPSSTIQVLGAEKALFRHLMKKTPPPKHGILFQHPLVNRAPKKLRGKIARTLASKIAVALKVDYYSKGSKDISEKLKKSLEERIKKLYEELENEG